MYTLNYLQFQTLRKDPTKYWNKTYTSTVDKNGILNTAAKAMFKNPKTFSDTFITPPDVTNEDPKAVLMIEMYSNMLLDYLRRHSEVEEELINQFTATSRKTAGLDKDYTPTDGIIKYGEYLLMKDERIEVSQSVESEALSYAKRFKSFLISDGEETEKQYPNINDSPITRMYGGTPIEIWIRPKIQTVIERIDEIKGKAISVGLDEQPDHILYYPDTQNAEITNLYICDSVTEFPDLFKQHNMGQLAEFQHMVLGKIFKECRYNFYVLDASRKYKFEVSDIKDLTSEIAKAIYTLARGSHLPYEYDKKEVTL